MGWSSLPAAGAAAGAAADASATAAGTAATVSATSTAAELAAAVATAAPISVASTAGPSLLAYTGLASTALSGGISALGAEHTAEANQGNALYQQQVAKNNQSLANTQANQAAAAGSAQEDSLGLKQRAVAGQLEASQAANGLDIGSGSNLDVRESQDALNAYDTATLRHDTATKIYGYQVAGVTDQGQAGLYGAQAADASTAGNIAATGSLLSTAGQETSQYFNWMKVAGDSGKGPAPSATFH